MTAHAWAATFGSICFLAAVALAVWALCVRATEVRADDQRESARAWLGFAEDDKFPFSGAS